MTHLVRAASLMLLVIAGIVVARGVSDRVSLEFIGLVQGDNASEWAALEPQIGEAGDCQRCHEPVLASWETSAHVGMPCATCHGPLSDHAATGEPVARAAATCESCHAQLSGRPGTFPQVDPAQHEPQSACAACHSPHAPAVAAPDVTHRLRGREDCVACHAEGGTAPLPPNHLDRSVELCTGCHRPEEEDFW